MKFYKHNSEPLEEIQLNLGVRGFDKNGNYVEGDAFGEATVIAKSVLNDGERMDKFERDKFLKAFWAITNKQKNVLHDSNI